MIRDLDVYSGPLTLGVNISVRSSPIKVSDCVCSWNTEFATSDLSARGVDTNKFDACLLLPVKERTANGCFDYEQTRGLHLPSYVLTRIKKYPTYYRVHAHA